MIYSRYYAFPFEIVHPYKWTYWMQVNWHYSIYTSMLYVALIYFGRRIMRYRQPFDLRKPLIMWNSLLAVFSVIGLLRYGPRFLHNVTTFNFYYTVCVNNWAYDVAGFWTNMFANSKILEFGDTLFIVARKRPLIFLHWYHHITVLVYTWHAYKDHTAAGQWFITMNYFVHSVMYSYYALTSVGWKVPRSIAMGVTALQIIQMTLGVHVTVSAYTFKLNGRFCQQTYENIHFAFLIYFSYFCLFAHFFYKVYVKGVEKTLRYARTCLVISNCQTEGDSQVIGRDGQGDSAQINREDVTKQDSDTELRHRPTKATI